MDEQPEFAEVILRAQRDNLNSARLCREAIDVTGRLLRDNPGIGALVIECTDLAPYAPAIQELTGLPVFDIVTLTEMLHRALGRRLS